MKTISFQAFTDAGCMVIFDPAYGFDLTDEWLSCLNLVTDPDGKTCATSDYPQGEWPSVWQRNVRRLREMSRSGEFTLLLCDEVEHACRISDAMGPDETQRLRCTFEEWIHCPSGRLIFGDAMTAFSGDLMEAEPLAELAVSPSWNKITIHSLAEPSDFDRLEGYAGSSAFPTLVFTVSAAAASPIESRLEEIFPRVENSHTRSIGSLCEATVIGIESSLAKLQLHTSRSSSSGWARMQVSECDPIHAGDHLVVRLVEQKKAYWVVEKT